MARHKEFDQEKALNQALELFWEKGYESTSVQDLCDKLGINRGSLYDTFGDKRELFLACLDRFAERIEDELNSILKEDAGDPKQQLERFFDRVIDISMNDPSRGRGCLIANSTLGDTARDPEVAGRVTAYYMNQEALFHRFLMKARQKGKLTGKHSPRELARYLLSTRQGLLSLAKTAPDRSMLEEIYKVALSAVF
ncbi:TetR/AcrR family transcriptional regulator [Paenibacillus humicola]|uniref:TetR/AcrR family transcriptional regulator n=1 Tax=Paenibacillus humicola TaxID=3110540 RepID=UPI00237B148C|nr:TetR/AcrR family transcriptional regulator [Paenibacillus humicola]